MDMAVEARYSHVPLTAKERGLFLVNAHFLPTTKKLIIIRNSRKGRPRNGGGDHHDIPQIIISAVSLLRVLHVSLQHNIN